MEMNDLIKRSDAIKAIVNTPSNIADVMGNNLCLDGAVFRQNEIIDILKDIPSAEPWDIYNCDEWCTDCKEYDTENHRCPRWNKVIRRTLEENPPVVNCVGCVHWVNDVANPDRMMCEKLKIPTEDFFFCGWGEREGADDE